MFLFLDISGGEILLVVLAGMLLFGKDKLPGILRGIAKGSDYLKKASEEVKQQIHAETGLHDAVSQVRDELEKTTQQVAGQVRRTVAPGEEIARQCADAFQGAQQDTPDENRSCGEQTEPDALSPQETPQDTAGKTE